jgi:hypothetical protein
MRIVFDKPKTRSHFFMKQKNWFRPKSFTHLTKKLGFEDGKWIKNYVADPVCVSSHKFYPLIHRVIVTKRFKTVGVDENGKVIKAHYSSDNGKRKTTAKYREIYYPNHLDAHIYSYYAQKVLGPLYENELKRTKVLDESIIAYRAIPTDDNSRCKCNIDFANEVFNEISSSKEEKVVLALDISKFFDSLNHKKLKQVWASLLGRKDLPADHYSVFKSLTHFSFVDLGDILEEFGINHPKKIIQKNIPCFVGNGREFRTRIKEKGLLKKNPFRQNSGDEGQVVGIPQGTPISPLLANMYLLEFDKEVISLLGDNSSFYRRYSDDILIMCSKGDSDKIEMQLYSLIQKYDLIIQKSKTQKSYFKDGRLLKDGRPINYLGLQFDGNRKLLKSSTLSKFYRKLKAHTKFRAIRALLARQKNEKGYFYDATLHRKKLYERFSFLGASKSSFKKRNIFSYANFASEIMNSPAIKRQLSKAWTTLHIEINYYEAKYNLPQVKKLAPIL